MTNPPNGFDVVAIQKNNRRDQLHGDCLISADSHLSFLPGIVGLDVAQSILVEVESLALFPGCFPVLEPGLGEHSVGFVAELPAAEAKSSLPLAGVLKPVKVLVPLLPAELAVLAAKLDLFEFGFFG